MADRRNAARRGRGQQRGRGNGRNFRGNAHINQPDINGGNLPGHVQRGRANGGDHRRVARGGAHQQRVNNEELVNQEPQQRRTARESRPMGFIRMRELRMRPANEIMFTLMDPSEGFQKLISLPNLNLEKLVLILDLLAQACTTDQRESLRNLLISVQKVQQFVIVSLQSYLCEMQNVTFANGEEGSVGNFVTFLETLQDLEPGKTVTILSMLIPQLKETLDILADRVPKELADRTKEMETKKNKSREMYSVSFLAEQRAEPPPNDFRSVPLFPDAADISNKHPFLRPNIVNGRYQDTEHYLDVQFRLLREDFIRPLREGIASYVKLGKNNERLTLQDVRIYKNVRIGYPLLSRDGIIYAVQFDVTPFRRIKWENSKRLIFGSLLCFSSDNFETMIFGTVAIRKPEELQKGVFSVKIEDHRTIPEIRTDTFVMLETQAYFEAYRYNLLALQNMDESTLSFKEFIVELSRQVGPPVYIAGKEKSKYCLTPLISVKSNGDRYVGDMSLMPTGGCRNCYFPSKCYDILNDAVWPSSSELSLDQSQFDAFKMALTKQLAIIQGPPGTGKTFVGLKIIQALLHNFKVWEAAGRGGQILVICYTNHALDQFLEGVLKYTTSMVRIGGRSQNEILSEYNMRNLKRKLAFERRRSRYLFRNDFEVRHELEDLVKEIDELRLSIKECQKSILEENELRVVIDDDQFLSLTEDYPEYFVMCEQKMPYWLGVAIPGMTGEYYPEIYDSDDENTADMQDVQIPEPAVQAEALQDGAGVADEQEIHDQDGNEGDDIENGGDVEYLNDLRTEGDEFADARAILLRDRQRINIGNILENFPAPNNEWKFQGGKKRQRKAMVQALRKCSPMLAEEIELVKNVWQLSLYDRRRLYKAWIERFEIYVVSRLEELNQEYQVKLNVAIELSCEEDFEIASEKKVIGMTTTGAAKYQSLVRKLKPRIIIVEEAAEVMEAHIITALTESTHHLILIGDHQQLRPNPTVYELAKRFKLDVSLFERLVNNGLPFCRLGIQHRMKPCIAKLLVPHVYSSLEDHSSVKEYEEIKGTAKSMFFINHQVMELSERDSTSRLNLHEADYLVRLCRHLLLQGYQQDQITILATYAGQFLLLKRMTVDPLYKGVRITVVDNFQGEENDIILLSLVRSNQEGNVGFLKIDNRVCVALSRAKKGLYCIGNFDLLKQESKLWENIYQELVFLDAIGPSLDLRCQNHGNDVSIKEPSDFDNVINGGCSSPCDFRLQCGHCCGLLCHPYDKEHVDYKCNKLCEKVICDLGHKCPKVCYLPCGPCEVIVPKMLACGHEAAVACHLDPSEVKCFAPCRNILGCGHNCLKRCSQDCGTCTVLVTVQGSCKHNIRIECGKSNNEAYVQENCLHRCDRVLSCKHPCPDLCRAPCPIACKVKVIHTSLCGHSVETQCYLTYSEHKVLAACNHPCRMMLECGHICSGKCSSCRQGRMHVPCKEQCGRLLVCGHVCKFPCSKNCPPCSRRCENRCIHSRCWQPCGIPCIPCKELCEWRCEHLACSMKCSEPCNRMLCKEPCRKRLKKCGHQCIGLCGEPCPKLCRICNYKRVTEIFFGDEDEPSACFIELEDCRHVFEASGLEKWIQNQTSSEIQLPTCPRCKTPIRSNLHFSSYVKMCVSKVEKVKLKSLGQFDRIVEKKRQLQNAIQTGHPLVWDICIKSQAIRQRLRVPKMDGNITNILILAFDTLENRERHIISFDLLVQLENVVKFVNEIRKIDELLARGMGQSYSEHLIWSLEDITKVINDNIIIVSNQLMEDVTWELRRLFLLAEFVKDAEKSCISNAEAKSLFTNATTTLMMLKPFRGEQETLIKDVRDKLRSVLGSAVIGVSQEEKLQILKAMNLSQGHWYQCPNGHVYCIADCGGAMVESRCNECNAVIGGGNHALRGDNRISTAMDGAQFSAWSDMQNMRNFNFDDFQ